MRILKLIGTIAIGVTCVLLGRHATADTIQTWGAGSAVTQVDLSTTFDALDFAHSGTPLSDYQTNGLFIKTNGNSYYGDDQNGFIQTAQAYFNPFHLLGPNSVGHSYYDAGGGFYFPYDGDFGNTDWVTLETVNLQKIYGVEFLYGNGWTTGDIYGAYPWGSNTAVLEWKTLNGGVTVSSGTVSSVAVGTVLGFSDSAGFDQLMVRCPHPNSGNPALQELAMDNLNVQTSPVPEPSAFVLLGIGIVVGLYGYGWHKRSMASFILARSKVIVLAAMLGVALHAGAVLAEITTFFNSSQVAALAGLGATSNTIQCDGYQFTHTLDKFWSSTGSGTPTGRITPINWPTGIDAQTITSGPNGVLSSQIPAQITITRVDGSLFDLISFQGTLLGNTAGAGANFEVMPLLNGNDGLANPMTFPATGYSYQTFDCSPNLIGYDTYNISLWMDFGLTALSVNGNPVPEPSSIVLVGLAIMGLMLGKNAFLRPFAP